MTSRIFRYEVPVPVDGRWYEIECGDPLAVSCRDSWAVEFWAVRHEDVPPAARAFMVVGTGDRLPDESWRYWGTAVDPAARFVWHLLERVS